MSLVIIVSLFKLISCSPDSELFIQEVVSQNSNESIDNNNTGNSSFSNKGISSGKGNPNWFPANPSFSEPADGTTYTPTSSADITNATNAGKTAIISASFDCTNCTFAANQKIRPAGGAISGTNINLNGAYIDDVAQRAFATSARFASVYDKSWVFLETFGGVANDANDDTDAIDALANNVVFGRNATNGLYIKNKPSGLNRLGNFIWDMNNSKTELTASETYPTTGAEQGFFSIFQTNVKMYNGEIDFNNRHSVFITAGGQEAYHYENLYIHDLENVNGGMRTIAFMLELNTSAAPNSYTGGIPWGVKTTNNRFVNGYIKGCRVENLKGLGASLPSASSQGIWFQLRDIDPNWNALAYQEGNTIKNVTGVEAEGIYFDEYTWWTGTKIDVNNTLFEVNNDSIYNCEDRAIKATLSNITLKNSYFGSIDPALAAPQGGGLVSLFTLRDNNNLPPSQNFRTRNILVENNIFDSPYGARQESLQLSNNLEGVTVRDNLFRSTSTGNYPGVMLGVFFQGLPEGYAPLENILITGNTYENLGIEFNMQSDFSNLVIDGETFTWNYSGAGGGFGQGIFRYNGFGDPQIVGPATIRNITATVTNASSSFGGLLQSRAVGFVNTTWENINLTYTNGFNKGGGEFMTHTGNFDNTNSVTNATMTGASGKGAIFVGTNINNPILKNCIGDGETITVR